MRSSWPGCSSSSSAVRTDNASEAIAGQSVQIGDKGPPALLARSYEPRNHAVFLRQCASVPSLCLRFGHDRAVPVPRGLAKRPLEVSGVGRRRSPLGRGDSARTELVTPLNKALSSRPGRFDIDGCSSRARGHDGLPQTRDVSPPGAISPRPRGISRPVPQAVCTGDIGWRRMVKMVVQRSSP